MICKKMFSFTITLLGKVNFFKIWDLTSKHDNVCGMHKVIRKLKYMNALLVQLSSIIWNYSDASHYVLIFVNDGKG